MKKITFYTIATLFLLSLLPTDLKASNKTSAVSATSINLTSSDEANRYINRLNEINAMDKSALSTPKKRILRKEVTAIRKQLQTLDGGVYISVGAIIIILLLLIILF